MNKSVLQTVHILYDETIKSNSVCAILILLSWAFDSKWYVTIDIDCINSLKCIHNSVWSEVKLMCGQVW